MATLKKKMTRFERDCAAAQITPNAINIAARRASAERHDPDELWWRLKTRLESKTEDREVGFYYHSAYLGDTLSESPCLTYSSHEWLISMVYIFRHLYEEILIDEKVFRYLFGDSVWDSLSSSSYPVAIVVGSFGDKIGQTCPMVIDFFGGKSKSGKKIEVWKKVYPCGESFFFASRPAPNNKKGD